ncbi:MAG: glycosyltransferase family 4 protein [Bacteroidetes bacterium]|nr:glycosyltransferase family 4 protein [Bacteroidota bacterium]MCL2302549.1 glycosyltransferase family 4 protein [Lentimicrobiaceae bacterium]
MKVCHLTSVHIRYDVRIFHKECCSLEKNGYHVSLIVADSKGDEIKNGVKIIDVGISTKSRLLRMLKTTKAVYKKAIEVDADVYHFHDPELIPYGLRLIKKGKKVIYDVHESVVKDILCKKWIPGILRKIISKSFERLEQYAIKRFTAVVTATPSIAETLKNGKRVLVINNYPILSLQNEVPLPSWSSRQNTCIYIGDLTEVRGVLTTIESVGLSKSRLVLGGSFTEPMIEERAQQTKGWEKVDYLGYVNRAQFNNVLDKSKIGLVLLHPIPTFIDSLPTKLFEYMSRALPVLCSDFPLWKEIVEESQCGICVNPFDFHKVAEAINFLIDNPEKAKEMGVSGQNAVREKYNWATQEEILLDLYCSLSSG